MNIILRPAAASDSAAIRKLIRTVGINPMALDWRRFTIATSEDGAMLGCGQIKPHGDDTYELASIAVWPRFQGQGVGRAIIMHLLAEAPSPLYLTCRTELRTYYEKFGFQSLVDEQLPPYFRRLWRIARMVTRLSPRMGSMQIMRKD
jgi:N-acetylglutamate synthase-like GNAT family acetyltransferase